MVFAINIAFAQQKDQRFLAKVATPSVYISPNGVGFFGLWDVEMGYHFTKHFSLCVGGAFGRSSYDNAGFLCKKYEKSIVSSARLYLDSRRIFFVGLGTNITFGHADAYLDEQTIGQSEDFWRHSVNSYAGVDLYFLPREKPFNFGLELLFQKNLLVWGNYDTWTYALDVRSQGFSIALFANF